MGREFEQLFDEWATTYDETVVGKDPEYKDVFLHYDSILKTVANKSIGTVLEFGVGTGNLTRLLLNKGLTVVGIEPSKEMRLIAKQKNPELMIYDGDFLIFPKVKEEINSIVSTYAFHHLTDDEKRRAIQFYASMLQTEDKIIFADTMFINLDEKLRMTERAKQKGYTRLVEDLQTEYYTTIPILENMLTENSFSVKFEQINSFVWVLEAIKN